ncbi:MAG: FecR family protein [Asticcacaulis sp.]
MAQAEKTQIAEEAAIWHARLQGDEVTPDDHAAFDGWLRTSPVHQQAYESASDIWRLLPEAAALKVVRRSPSWRPMAQGMALAACLLLSVGLGVYFMNNQPTVYETGHGQQQVVALKDGTEVTLNTDSRLTVSYSGKQRRAVLERGEAFFDVESNPDRPFVVQVGEERVRVLGTSFVVRHEPERFSVTLVEGRLEVSGPEQAPVVLAAGQRAMRQGDQAIRVDQPEVQTVTAWQKGEIILSDTRLSEAVAEFNRYAAVPIVLKGSEVGALRISGVFQTNRSADFALTVAELNGLKVRQSSKAIELTR